MIKDSSLSYAHSCDNLPVSIRDRVRSSTAYLLFLCPAKISKASMQPVFHPVSKDLMFTVPQSCAFVSSFACSH